MATASTDAALNPLRLLWLTENYPPDRGGMAQSCDRLVQSLAAEGAVVNVAHFSRRGAHGMEERQHGRYYCCPIEDDPEHALNLLWNSLEQSRTPLTHVVAFGGILPLLAGPVYAAWLELPLVTLIRGNDFDTGIFSSRRVSILRFALERSAAICCVSQDKRRRIAALYPDRRVVWIPNGIDRDDWKLLPSDRTKAASWKLANVQPGRRVLGMFGQLKRKKGGPFFLEALLQSGHADRFHLLFVGDAEDALLEWLTIHQDRIAYSFFPFVDRYQLLTHYAACDMMVIPSFYDGLPNVMMEAAALSIPFLASTAGGMGDLLADSDHGVLFLPGDAHACRKAIDRAARLTDDELQRMGECCLQLVETNLDHRVEARRYREILLETAGR